MNEDQIKEKGKAAFAWADAHRKFTLGVVCFILGFVVGKML